MSKSNVLIILLGALAAFPALAIDNALTERIDANINEYIGAVLSNSGSDIYLFVMAVATFLMFVCAAGEILKFIAGKADWEAMFTLVILWIVTLALITAFALVTDTIKYAFNELADTFQFLMVGSRDKLFLSNFIDNVITQGIQTPDVGFTDAVYMWAVTIIWAVISLLLQVAFYLSDVYATLGMGLAQILGVLFIPFLIAPWTRGIFDGWVKFFIGWGVCGLVLRITCLMSMLVMKASINAAGDFENPGSALINSHFDISAPLVVTDENLSLLIAIIVFGFISCVMIFSSYSFAKMLASGVGSASNAATSAAKQVAAQAVKALIL